MGDAIRELCQRASRDVAVRREYQKCTRVCTRALLIKTTRNAYLQALCESPLTDSNRRPPPYHGTSHATGCNPRQRFWLVLLFLRSVDLPLISASCNHGAPQRLHPVGALRLTFARLPTTRCCDCGLAPSRACVVRSGGRPRPDTLGRAVPTVRRAVSISSNTLMARSSVMMSARVIDSASSMKAPRRYVTRSSRLRRSRGAESSVIGCQSKRSI
jgi:hypothetical protein